MVEMQCVSRNHNLSALKKSEFVDFAIVCGNFRSIWYTRK